MCVSFCMHKGQKLQDQVFYNDEFVTDMHFVLHKLNKNKHTCFIVCTTMKQTKIISWFNNPQLMEKAPDTKQAGSKQTK